MILLRTDNPISCELQVAGIRFIWENIIQSVRKVRSGDKGLGCILAHTMGLGKTFQVVVLNWMTVPYVVLRINLKMHIRVHG